MKRTEITNLKISFIFKSLLGIIVLSLIGCTPEPELKVMSPPLVAPSQNMLKNTQAPIIVSGGRKPYALVVTSGSASGEVDSETAIFKSTATFGKTIIQITDSRNTVSTTEVNVIDEPPVINYIGGPFVYVIGTTINPLEISSTGGAIVTCSITPNLPSGLIFNNKTCNISGTPNKVSNQATYTVTASNSGGNKSVNLNLIVNDMLPSLANYADTVMIKNSYYSIPAPVSKGGVINSYSSVTSLPAGLTLNNTTGVISGTPTTASEMNSYTVKVAGASGSINIKINITVNPAIRIVLTTHSKINDVMPPVKVVLIVDNSGSMANQQTNLALGIDKMLTALSGFNLSFYMYTTTSVNNQPSKNLLVSSTKKPVSSFENFYTYNDKVNLQAPQDTNIPYSITTNYTLNDSLLGISPPTFSATKNNALAQSFLVEEIKKVGIIGDGANEAGICSIGRILADENHKVVNKKDASGKGDKVAFVILSDENDFSTNCDYSKKADFTQNPLTNTANQNISIATKLGATNDDLIDGVILKANQMFGKDGYMVSAIINTPNINMTNLGVPYENFLDKLPNQFGAIGNINNNDYSKELEGIKNFVIKYNVYDFPVNLAKGESIKSVQIEKNSKLVDVKYTEIKNSSGTPTAVSIASGDLVNGDKITIVVNGI